jgi:hypothetical protein
VRRREKRRGLPGEGGIKRGSRGQMVSMREIGCLQATHYTTARARLRVGEKKRDRRWRGGIQERLDVL